MQVTTRYYHRHVMAAGYQAVVKVARKFIIIISSRSSSNSYNSVI
jgi:hypothetical protein